MIRRLPRSTRTYTLFPYTTLCRSLYRADVQRLPDRRDDGGVQRDADIAGHRGLRAHHRRRGRRERADQRAHTRGTQTRAKGDSGDRAGLFRSEQVGTAAGRGSVFTGVVIVVVAVALEQKQLNNYMLYLDKNT